jgi:hypothetical protein
MSLVELLVIYLFFCLMYRNRQLSYIFILRSLQTLKISKYRDDIVVRIEKHEKRFKWYLIWPLIDLYEWYEDWQKNRNRNTKP